jgi:hypothetical protein
MPELCVIDQCRRTSRAVCKCCHQDLCLEHFWQHNDSIRCQLNTLKKELNDVESRFKFLDTGKSVTTFRRQMKQWRIDSYTTVDHFYDRKCQEFNRYIQAKVGDSNNDIDRLQRRINDFIDIEYGGQRDIDFIKSNINALNGKAAKLEQTPFPITISPLKIDENLIQIN